MKRDLINTGKGAFTLLFIASIVVGAVDIFNLTIDSFSQNPIVTSGVATVFVVISYVLGNWLDD